MKELDDIYFAARDLPPEARAAYLAEVCADNSPLRVRVEEMLAVTNEAEAFVIDRVSDGSEAGGAGTGPAESVPPVPDETVGSTLGRYKILERVGEGGCGVVYVAEQTEPVRRRVALKVIKLGMDTKQVVARFEAERQALAMMDHPNIARVIDAGMTEAGRPYFVMELVRGIKITDYCEQAQLSTRDRLDLFMQVCQAIQHAHQKGIIHRDIKPANILVMHHNGLPVPKVIDFGIAKATEGRLTNATVYTQLHQFIGTPAYMSPEQAEMNGLDIDTRSDIYSLGVLLYELLAGSTPFDAEALLASGVDLMRKTIREKEPVRPSTKLRQTIMAHTPTGSPEAKAPTGLTTTAAESAALRRRRQAQLHELTGDLDWIVMKCLEKDRARRYETANGLAADLKRHLSHEPVLARPPSAAYRFKKSFRRNKLAYIATAAIALSLLVGTGLSTWQAVEATRARKAEVKQRLAAQDAQAQAAALQHKAEAERQRAEAQLTRAEWLVYAGKLLLAQTDFEAGYGGLASEYLNECQEDLRGWEHRYLRRRLSAKSTFAGHTDGVLCVTFHPEGRRIATGGLDQSVKVWDAVTGQLVLSLKGHTFPVLSVAFSPDGRRIVTGSGSFGAGARPSEAKVWDAETGQELLVLEGHPLSVLGVAFSPDGERIATGGGDWGAGEKPGEVKIWNAVSGDEIVTIRGFTAGVRSVAFSPDGQWIVTGGWDLTAKVWSAATGQEVLALRGHTHWANSAAFSADGRFIVTGSDDRSAKIWDAATGREMVSLKEHSSRVTSVAFSPDGRRVLTGGADPAAKMWDAKTGRELFTLKGHAGVVTSVAFSRDGREIVTGSQDGRARVWNASTGQEVPILKGHGDSVVSIAFSQDSQRIATASTDRTARIWDTATARQLVVLRGHSAVLGSVAFSPDGRRVVTGSKDELVKVWDAGTGRELLSLDGHFGGARSVAFSPDGARILAGAGEGNSRRPGEAKLWDVTARRELLSVRHAEVVHSVAFSPDGRRFVTAGSDRTAKIWDSATGGELLVLQGHAAGLHSVAFSPDGRRIVTGSRDQTAKIWDAETGRDLLTLNGHNKPLRSVAFSPDGLRIVTGSEDRTARIWNALTGLEALTLRAHAEMVWSVAFSPDGLRIVTGIIGANATAKIWEAFPEVGIETGRGAR